MNNEKHPLEYDPVGMIPKDMYYNSALKINDCALTRHLWHLYDRIEELESKINSLAQTIMEDK